MFFPQIARKSNSDTYSLTASSVTTPAIPYGEFASGGYVLSAVATAATANYYGGESATGTFRPIYDSAGTPAPKTQAVAVDRAFAVPSEALAFSYIKIVLDAGTATAIFSRKG